MEIYLNWFNGILIITGIWMGFQGCSWDFATGMVREALHEPMARQGRQALQQITTSRKRTRQHGAPQILASCWWKPPSTRSLDARTTRTMLGSLKVMAHWFRLKFWQAAAWMTKCTQLDLVNSIGVAVWRLRQWFVSRFLNFGASNCPFIFF